MPWEIVACAAALGVCLAVVWYCGRSVQVSSFGIDPNTIYAVDLGSGPELFAHPAIVEALKRQTQKQLINPLGDPRVTPVDYGPSDPLLGFRIHTMPLNLYDPSRNLHLDQS